MQACCCKGQPGGGYDIRPFGLCLIFQEKAPVHTEFSAASVCPMKQVVRDAISIGMDEILMFIHASISVFPWSAVIETLEQSRKIAWTVKTA